MATVEVLKEILIDSTSCGSSDLRDFLADQADVLMCLFSSCADIPEISYLELQLNFTEVALSYVRNRIDIANARSETKGLDRFRSETETDSAAQRTSRGTSCSFSDASSFQQFIRDSVNTFRSQSDTVSDSEGDTCVHRWDRSVSQASGYSNVFDGATSSTVGDGFGNHAEQTQTSGKSYSKTNPFFGPGQNDLDPGEVDWGTTISNATEAVLSFWENLKINFNIFGGGEASQDWNVNVGGVIPGVSDEIIADTISVGFSNPGIAIVPHCPGLGCCCSEENDDPLTPPCPPGFTTECVAPGQGCSYDSVNPFPTYGRGYNVRYNFSIGIPSIGVLRTDWGNGEQFRQSHIMTQGCTRTSGGGATGNDYAQTDESESHGETDTHDESFTQRDIHTRGTSRRDSRSDTTAGSATTGDAHSESSSGGDREQHTEREQEAQGTNWSRNKGSSEGLNTTDMLATTESKRYGQIFSNLQKMWNRIFEQLMEARQIRAASAGPVVTCMTTCLPSIPSNPVCDNRHFGVEYTKQNYYRH